MIHMAAMGLISSALFASWCAFRLGYATAMQDALTDLLTELDRVRTPESCMMAGRVADRIGARAWKPWWKRTIGGR